VKYSFRKTLDTWVDVLEEVRLENSIQTSKPDGRTKTRFACKLHLNSRISERCWFTMYSVRRDTGKYDIFTRENISHNHLLTDMSAKVQVPGTDYTVPADYHFSIKFCNEAELELHCKTKRVNRVPHRSKGIEKQVYVCRRANKDEKCAYRLFVLRSFDGQFLVYEKGEHVGKLHKRRCG